MRSETIFITGSTDGVGRVVALQLARSGAQVVLHGRDATRGEALSAEIRGETGRAAPFYRADLASLAAVEDLARRVAADHPRLDVLINNAGIGSGAPGDRGRQHSADGYELRFAVNGKREMRADAQAYDAKARARLFELSLRMVGLSADPF